MSCVVKVSSVVKVPCAVKVSSVVKVPCVVKVVLANSKSQGNARDVREEDKMMRLFIMIPTSFTDKDVKDEFSVRLLIIIVVVVLTSSVLGSADTLCPRLPLTLTCDRLTLKLICSDHHHHHIRFWYLWCCGCPGLRGRQHLATPHTRSP